MKKIFTILLLASLSSCATVFHGKVSDCQRTKPQPKQTQRKIKVGALIFDALGGGLPIIIDFATGAIYKCSDTTNIKK